MIPIQWERTIAGLGFTDLEPMFLPFRAKKNWQTNRNRGLPALNWSVIFV